jgi:hypothetical protein
MDPYSKSRYEHGIDAKIVVMGNTGLLFGYQSNIKDSIH